MPVLYCMQWGCTCTKLAETDSDASWRKGAYWCIDWIATDWCADYDSYRKGTCETYGGWWLPTGNLPCGTSGTSQSKKYSSGTVLWIPTGSTGRDDRTSNGRCPEDAGNVWCTGGRGRNCNSQRDCGCRSDAGLSERSGFLHTWNRKTFLQPQRICAM